MNEFKGHWRLPIEYLALRFVTDSHHNENSYPAYLSIRAGLIYLVLFCCGAFALTVQARLMAPADFHTRIVSSEMLFRYGFFSELVMAVAYLFVALTLYRIFHRESPNRSREFLVLAVVGVASICSNAVHQFSVLDVLISDAAGFTKPSELLHADAQQLLTSFKRGWTISGIFTGLWLLPLGLAVIKSDQFPSVFGVGLVVACFGYLFPAVTVFLAPELARWNLAVMSVSGIAEILFGLWLLAAGMLHVYRRRGM